MKCTLTFSGTEDTSHLTAVQRRFFDRMRDWKRTHAMASDTDAFLRRVFTDPLAPIDECLNTFADLVEMGLVKADIPDPKLFEQQLKIALFSHAEA
jgi:hypothetical protein